MIWKLINILWNAEMISLTEQKRLREQAKTLFLHHSNLVRLVAFDTAPSRDLVDDIVNDTFIVFVSSPEKWDLTQPVQPLLRKITRNIAMRYWKKKVNLMAPKMQALAEIVRKRYEEQFQEEDWELSDKVRALDECLDKLPPHQKKLLNEHYVRLRSYVELEEEFQKSPNALQKIVFRLRTALERCVESSLNLWKGAES